MKLDEDKNEAEAEVGEEFVPEENEGESSLGPEAKVKRLQEKLKLCQTEKQEYLETSQRLRADYVNLKRREEEARSEIVKFAREPLLLDLLELADVFELAFANKETWETVAQNWRHGVEYIYSKLITIFEQNNLAEINPVGQDFDPSEHHSIGQVAADKKEDDNKVLEVVQKGYKLNSKIIRPAKVKIGHYE
ncbi:MAG: nucleotide exchange factor GrpE [Candidatus Vogelbacteria bacterium]|nr:nucleotide exchange factor GrpE [Candidatus Vogelbacteria bacterium]